MTYLVENNKTGAHHRCASEGQARRWADHVTGEASREMGLRG